ncbi:MAG TPA: hypothetical protein VNC50_07950, partial [Planctomycetia bacterium]|nr:hypothetical protein [Planctomycetia bacterium]
MNSIASALCAAALFSTAADDSASPALNAPRTRVDVRRSVEAQKGAKPNLPLPPEAERTRGNNGSMQRYYLPKEWQTNSFGRRGDGKNDPKAGEAKGEGKREGKRGEGRGEGRGGMGGAFNTQMFWIVSRTNDCRYCLGHQEAKLSGAGLSEEQIASLDGDWSKFAPPVKAALAYARKVTLEPHKVTAADVEELVKLHGAPGAVGIISACAGFNRMNRWTGSLNIPQDKEPMGRADSLDGPAASEYATADSVVMPKHAIARPPLESRAEVEKALAAAKSRSANVPVPAAGENAAPAWTRAA